MRFLVGLSLLLALASQVDDPPRDHLEACADSGIGVEAIDRQYFRYDDPTWISHAEYFELGGVHGNEVHLAVLFLVRLSAGTGSRFSYADVEIEVSKGSATRHKIRQRVPTLKTRAGTYTLPVLVNSPLCENVGVAARVLGCQGEVLDAQEDELVFHCGE